MSNEGIVIYTDGCSIQNRGSSVSIIVDGNIFVGELIDINDKVGSTEAELIAVRNSLEFIDKTYSDYTGPITIYTDMKSTARVFKKLNGDIKKTAGLAHNKHWEVICNLGSKYKVSIKHIHSHAESFNPNKACDITARVVLTCGTA